jgi:hypothetical protein
MVKCIFLYTNNADHVVTNLMTAAKINKIPVVCYSTIDQEYHFYDSSWKMETMKKAEDVIDHMYKCNELEKLVELFPEFEILPPPPVDPTIETTLQKCQRIIKPQSIKYDANLARIKKMERDRVKVDYPDDLEKLTKKMHNVNFLSKFLKKK